MPKINSGVNNSKIKEIIDVTKIAIMLTLEDWYSSELHRELDESVKRKLSILAINNVFLEQTDPSKNDVKETSPDLVEHYLEPITKFILRECGPILSNAIRLKALAISKCISPNHGMEYLQAVKEYLPISGTIPTEEEAKKLIAVWNELKDDILKENNHTRKK